MTSAWAFTRQLYVISRSTAVFKKKNPKNISVTIVSAANLRLLVFVISYCHCKGCHYLQNKFTSTWKTLWSHVVAAWQADNFLTFKKKKKQVLLIKTLCVPIRIHYNHQSDSIYLAICWKHLNMYVSLITVIWPTGNLHLKTNKTSINLQLLTGLFRWVRSSSQQWA